MCTISVMDDKYLQKIAYTGETLEETKARIEARKKKFPQQFNRKRKKYVLS